MEEGRGALKTKLLIGQKGRHDRKRRSTSVIPGGGVPEGSVKRK